MHRGAAPPDRGLSRDSLLGLLLLAALSLVPWALLDQRPLNDHDPEFAGGVGGQALAWQQGSLSERAHLLRERLLLHGERHAQLPQAALLVWTGTFGWSHRSVRLSNLPWLFLLLVGTALVAAQLLPERPGARLDGERLALLAAFLVCTLPVVQHMSRKWFPHFFAAALAPLALWLVLRGVRAARDARPALGGWLALGCAQGARMHCHPIGMPDIAILTALAVGALAHGRAGRRAWAELAASIGLAAALGAPAVFAGALRDDAVGLPEYVALVGQYLRLSGGESGGIAPALGLALLPGAALLLVAPGAAGLAWPGPGGWPSFATRLVALRVALHVPAVILTARNGAFVADWLFLAPDCVILCLVGLDRLGSALGRARPWLLGAAAAQGAITLVVPWVLGVAVPDPMEPDALPRLAAPWIRSEHGGLYNTHHIPVRAPQPGARLARELQDLRPDRIGLLDLSWGSDGCAPPPAPGAWLWAPAAEGFSPIPGGDPFEEAWGRAPDWRTAEDSGAVAIVRLWQRGEADGPPCEASDRSSSAIVEAARGVAARRLGGTVVVLEDRAQWFAAAPRPSAQPVPDLLPAVLLVRRAALDAPLPAR